MITDKWFMTFLFLIGLSFWKVGSRKVFAIHKNDLNHKGKGKGKLKQKLDFSSSDEVEESCDKPCKKPRLSEVLAEVKTLKKDVDKVLRLSKGMTRSLLAH